MKIRKPLLMTLKWLDGVREFYIHIYNNHFVIIESLSQLGHSYILAIFHKMLQPVFKI